MIEIRNLKKRFGENVVLDGVSLQIEKGDIIAVIGPSGTGKSTLLRCIDLLEKPDEGYLSIGGVQIRLPKASRKEVIYVRKKTAMVFQSWNLFSKKTALENVMEGLVTVKKIRREEARRTAEEQLKNVGLLEWAEYYPKHLSGGQQQRVAIARALAMEPELLLLDEPTSALDPELVGEVLETIQRIAREGNTMLLVSHEMSFVRKVATRVIFLHDGHILADGTPREVFQNPKNQRVREFIRKIDLFNEPEYMI